MTDDAVTYRSAAPSDATAIAELHADSWRHHYRGAYSDEFFGASLDADRLSVWSTRLHDRGDAHTFVAGHANDVVGFVHVILDSDPEWGALVDNLHVRHDWQRRGIASQLMGRAAAAVEAASPGSGLYLWVLEQNTRAQVFYRSIGGRPADRRPVGPPALVGVDGIRYVWPNPSAMTAPRTQGGS